MTTLVIGATGQQGGAVVDALLGRGVSVRAAVRDPAKPAARALAERGVELAVGDLDSVESARPLFDGVDAAFAMTTFTGPGGIDGEVEQGRVLADAAAAVPFLVYSSVGGVERNSGVPHFESKARIEEFLASHPAVAFVRPTFFMENLLGRIRRTGDELSLALPLPDGVPLQMVAVRTIGEVAAALLVDRTPTAVEIAGDELTGSQLAAQIGGSYTELPLSVLGDDEDMTAMWSWFTRLPAYQADFARTHTLAPDAETFAQWLSRQEY
jgi:uncharacterized protein YbjT (DUF2867 family)